MGIASHYQSRVTFKKASALPWKEMRVRWQVLIPLLVIHIGAVAAPFFFTWPAFITALVLYPLTGLIGITCGYHRLVAHQAFETHALVKAFHLFFASLSLQQGPISWARYHRAHHRHADSIHDPHTQRYGFFFGHLGWSFLSHKTIGRSQELKHVDPDLRSDKVMVFFENYHLYIFMLSMLLFFVIGGLPMLLWAGCFRIAMVMHITWSVNSVTHRFGTRTYHTPDRSTNNWIVAILAWGEGWHNNHHRFPFSARQGLRWWQLDMSWWWISFLKSVGLAWDVRLPKGF